MATIAKPAFSQFRSADNVQYRIIDKNGKQKAIFQENALCKALLKNGLLSPLWINRWYAPAILPLLGYWASEKVIGNLVTTAGKALVAGLINGSGSPAAATYIAVGTGTTSAAAGNTALETETSTSGLARAAGTVSLTTTTTTNDTAQILKSFSVTGTVAVTESGVLNASSSGTLLCRQVFSAINVANGDTLQITWKVAVS